MQCSEFRFSSNYEWLKFVSYDLAEIALVNSADEPRVEDDKVMGEIENKIARGVLAIGVTEDPKVV